MKILIILFFVFISFKHSAQNYVPFRNVLNEGTYWFYEQNYDSACYYYKKAEYFNLKFFRMESHLYSRALWEIGDKKKSIKILLKGGARFSFINDTTFCNRNEYCRNLSFLIFVYIFDLLYEVYRRK